MSSKWKVKAGLNMLAVIRTMSGDGLRDGGGEGVKAGEEGIKGGIEEKRIEGGKRDLAANQAEGRTSAAGQGDAISKAEGV